MSELTSKLKNAILFLEESDLRLADINQDISDKKYALVDLPRAGRIQLKDIDKNDSLGAEIQKLEELKSRFTNQIAENREIVYEILRPYQGREISFDYLIDGDYTDTIMLEVFPLENQSVGHGFIRAAPRKPQFNIYLNKNKTA